MKSPSPALHQATSITVALSLTRAAAVKCQAKMTSIMLKTGDTLRWNAIFLLVIIKSVSYVETAGSWQSKEALWAVSHETLMSCTDMVNENGVGPCTVTTQEDGAAIRKLVAGDEVMTVARQYPMMPCSDETTSRIFAPLSRDPVQFGGVCASQVGAVTLADWEWRDDGPGDREFCKISTNICFTYESFNTGKFP